jgi:hypothetical protein
MDPTTHVHHEKERLRAALMVPIAFLLLLFIVSAALLTGVSKAEATAPTNLRIAVFGAAGTDPGYILAVERMFAAMGQQPMTIMGADISHGRLTTANFDVFVLPECEQTDPYGLAADGSTGISNMSVLSDQEYYVNLGGYYTGVASVSSQIQSFVSSGGKVIAIAGGANYLTASGTWGDYQGSSHTWNASTAVNRTVDLYGGTYTGPILGIGQGLGMINVPSTAPTGFTQGDRVTMFANDSAYFNTPVPTGSTVIANVKTGDGSTADGKPAIVGFTYGSSGGRGVVCAPSLELEPNSDRDWTAWDNIDAAGYLPQSNWPLMAQILGWVCTGSAADAPSISIDDPTTGKRMAIYARRDGDSIGGTFAGLFPAFARNMQHAGLRPLVIRPKDINHVAAPSGSTGPGADGTYLKNTYFDGLWGPGGTAYGYNYFLAPNPNTGGINGMYPNGLASQTGQASIRAFVNAGGGYSGASAGCSNAASTLIWDGTSITYTLGLYNGQIIAPLSSICPWPQFCVSKVHFPAGDAFYPAGGDLNSLYWGEGYYNPNGTTTLTTDGTLDDGVPEDGQPIVVHHTYGSGRCFYPMFHFEAMVGSTDDWCYWDNWKYGGTDPETETTDNRTMLDNGWNWCVANNPASSKPSYTGVSIPVLKTSSDTTTESLGDLQRVDAQTTGPVVYATSGTIPTAAKVKDELYTVAAGKTLCVTGFGKAQTTISGCTLEVVWESPNSGTAQTTKVQFSTNGTTWYDTTVQPGKNQSLRTATYNLYTNASNPVNTLAKLQSLQIRYVVASGKTPISFDQIKVTAAP